MEKNTLSRAALGTVAKLGDLYDSRKDDFVGVTIFNQKIPDEALLQFGVQSKLKYVVHQQGI